MILRSVVFDCPKTGAVVSSGTQMDEYSFEHYTVSNYKIRCRSCGEQHTLEKGDFRLGPPV